MKAKRPGRCPTCKGEIKIGEEILQARGRWQCGPCATKLLEVSKNVKPPSDEEVSGAKEFIDRITGMMLGRGAPVNLDGMGFNKLDYQPAEDWVDGRSKYRDFPGGWCVQSQRLGKYRRQLSGLGAWEEYGKSKEILERWADASATPVQEVAKESPVRQQETAGPSSKGKVGKDKGRGSRRRVVAPTAIPDESIPRVQPIHGWRIRLAPMNGSVGERIWIKFPFDREIINAVKRVDGRGWNDPTKEWHVPIGSGLMLAQELESTGIGSLDVVAQSIRELPGVTMTGEGLAARAQLSRAVSLDSLGEEGKVYVKEVDEVLTKALPSGYTLYPFQSVGVAYLVAAEGKAIIGDEMGTGKTIEALAFLAHEMKCGRDPFPCVVVCPAVVKLNWAREAEMWLGELGVRVAVTYSTDPVPDCDVLIINYDLMRKRVITEKRKLPGRKTKVDYVKEILNLPAKPRTVICDEFHKIKNMKAQRTIATLAYAKQAENQILLSGTPMLNRPIELFAGLNLVAPDTFPNFFGYAKRYCGAEKNRWGWDFTGATNLQELRDRLRTLMLRRVKADVLKELPAKRRARLTLELSNRKDYQKAEADVVEWLRENTYEERLHEAIGEGSQDPDTEARKAAGRKVAAAMRAEHLVRMNALRVLAGRGKAKAATEWILDFLEEEDRKLVVFAHHLEVIGAIHQAVVEAMPMIGMCILTGQTPQQKRQDMIDAFQSDPRCRLFVASTTAGGVGITLTVAQDVLFLEREWVPGDEEQAEDRCHRIGQEGSVTAWYAEAENTIDADFAALVSSKRAIVSQVMGDGDTVKKASLLSDVTNRLLERNC